MTATVTEIDQAPSVRVKHSWDKRPRRDDPTRHVYTCRRDGCGLKRRSELVDGEWLDFWLWPDGSQGSGRKVPSCRGGSAVESPLVLLTVAAVPVAVSTPPCCRCATPGVPPCGPTRLYLGGFLCQFQASLLRTTRTTNGGVA